MNQALLHPLFWEGFPPFPMYLQPVSPVTSRVHGYSFSCHISLVGGLVASVENGSGNLVASPRGEEADIVEYDEAVDEDAPVSLQFQEGDDILDYFYTMLDPKVEVLSEEEVCSTVLLLDSAPLSPRPFFLPLFNISGPKSYQVARRSESHQSSLAQAMEYLSQCSSLHDAAVTHVLQVDPSSGDFLQEVLEQLLAVKGAQAKREWNPLWSSL